MTPPRARTSGRRGHTPVIRVRGRSRRRTSVAALCCHKPGEPSRLIHRPRTHLLLKGARKSSPGRTTATCTHLAAGLKRYEAEHDWLTTVRLPPDAPDLNPVEAVWSLGRRAMANTAFTTPHDLDRKLRRELRRIQLRPHLIDGCLTATDLTIDPPTPPLKTTRAAAVGPQPSTDRIGRAAMACARGYALPGLRGLRAPPTHRGAVQPARTEPTTRPRRPYPRMSCLAAIALLNAAPANDGCGMRICGDLRHKFSVRAGPRCLRSSDSRRRSRPDPTLPLE